MKAVRVNHPEDFDTEVNKAVESGNPVFVLFFGTEDPKTSKSWCPDCVVADPLVRKAILQVENSILIEVPVGHRSEWKGNTSHPYRVRFNLPAIPTLYKWSTAGPGDKLVEEEAADIQKLSQFTQTMGNDGGSIPRRIELVKEKAKDIVLNPDLERAALWLFCALSKLPLEQPIVSDGLGKLYNQDAIIEYLLDPAVYGDGDKICSHITSLKDTKKLNLTPNPTFKDKETNLETMDNLEKNMNGKFICPISMKEMNGKHRFVYLDTCGCVFAEQALKEIPSKECVTCGKPFDAENIIVINPTKKEEQEKMKKAMEEKKARAKAEKKAKKGTSEKKRKRDASSEEKPVKKVNTIHSSAASAVMNKVAQELAEKEKTKQMSSAVKSIYGSKDKNNVNGNYLTKGTFTRY